MPSHLDDCLENIHVFVSRKNHGKLFRYAKNKIKINKANHIHISLNACQRKPTIYSHVSPSEINVRVTNENDIN